MTGVVHASVRGAASGIYRRRRGLERCPGWLGMFGLEIGGSPLEIGVINSYLLPLPLEKKKTPDIPDQGDHNRFLARTSEFLGQGSGRGVHPRGESGSSNLHLRYNSQRVKCLRGGVSL